MAIANSISRAAFWRRLDALVQVSRSAAGKKKQLSLLFDQTAHGIFLPARRSVSSPRQG